MLVGTIDLRPRRSHPLASGSLIVLKSMGVITVNVLAGLGGNGSHRAGATSCRADCLSDTGS